MTTPNRAREINAERLFMALRTYDSLLEALLAIERYHSTKYLLKKCFENGPESLQNAPDMELYKKIMEE